MPGVNGEAATVSRLAGQWASARRTPAQPVEAQRLYELGVLDPPGSVAGELRRATAADVSTLVAWDDAFAAETGLTRPAGVDRSAVIARRVAAGEWWVWTTAAGSMSMAYSSPPLAGAARIGAVYTPPEHRDHGYASAMVAALSANLRGAGVRECLLYAQLVNPASNRIYQRLGYEPVAEILAYRFG
jgi:predicted GNAT family acetyltransferase